MPITVRYISSSVNHVHYIKSVLYDFRLTARLCAVYSVLPPSYHMILHHRPSLPPLLSPPLSAGCELHVVFYLISPPILINISESLSWGCRAVRQPKHCSCQSTCGRPVPGPVQHLSSQSASRKRRLEEEEEVVVVLMMEDLWLWLSGLLAALVILFYTSTTVNFLFKERFL